MEDGSSGQDKVMAFEIGSGPMAKSYHMFIAKAQSGSQIVIFVGESRFEELKKVDFDWKLADIR